MDTTEKPSWWQRLSGGLKRTSASIGGALGDLVTKRKLDAAMLGEIEEVLIRADLGVDSAARVAAAVGEGRYDKAITPDEVKAVLAAEVEKIMAPVARPLAIGGLNHDLRASTARQRRRRPGVGRARRPRVRNT